MTSSQSEGRARRSVREASGRVGSKRRASRTREWRRPKTGGRDAPEARALAGRSGVRRGRGFRAAGYTRGQGVFSLCVRVCEALSRAEYHLLVIPAPSHLGTENAHTEAFRVGDEGGDELRRGDGRDHSHVRSHRRMRGIRHPSSPRSPVRGDGDKPTRARVMTYYCCGYWVTGTLWWPPRCRYCGKHMHTVKEASGSARRAAAADFGTDAGHYADTPPSPPTTSARPVSTTALWRAAPSPMGTLGTPPAEATPTERSSRAGAGWP